jgi:catechol 2,3-dioxygenase
MLYAPGELNVICTELERSLRFYRDILGFELLEQEGDAHRLRFGGTTLLLLPVARSGGERQVYCSIPTYSLDLMVEEIDEAFRHLTDAGVEIEGTPEMGSFIIRDPDGLVMEVIGKRA